MNQRSKTYQFSFKKEQTIFLDEQKHNTVTYPDRIIKLIDTQETLKRIKRTSTLLQSKDPQTPIDLLQIIHLVTKAEYAMLFEHQGYLLQGTWRLYLFIAIKLPRVSDLLHDPALMPHCHQWAEQWDVPCSQHSTVYNQQPYDEPIHQHICKELFDTYANTMNLIAAYKINLTYKIKHVMPALLPNKHFVFTEKMTGKRCKWAISMILLGLASLGCVIIKGLNSHLNHKRKCHYVKCC